MQRKMLPILPFLAMMALFFLFPTKVEAANYKLVRTGTLMQCIDEDTETVVTNKFVKLKGYTYYFDADGFAHTGWLKYGQDYYFFNANGAMLRNRWVGQYFLKKNGKMATNKWVTPTQYVGKNGKLIPGYTKKAKAKFIKTKNGKKYRNFDGNYSQKTWQSINGDWYYFYSSGHMATKAQIGEFYVGKNGKMVTNKRVKIGKYYYYYGADGRQYKKVKSSKNK